MRIAAATAATDAQLLLSIRSNQTKPERCPVERKYQTSLWPQLAPKSTMKVKQRQTSIEELYYYELLLNRLGAGLMFNTNKYAGLLYRTIMIVLAKFMLSGSFVSGLKVLNQTLSKVVVQNMRFFFLFYVAAALFATVITTLNSFVSHTPILVILKKRFDCCYLEPLTATVVNLDGSSERNQNCALGTPIFTTPSSTPTAERDRYNSAFYTDRARSSDVSSTSYSSDKSSPSFSSFLSVERPSGQLIMPSGRRLADATSYHKTIQTFGRLPRVKMVKWVLYVYLFAVTAMDTAIQEYYRGTPIKLGDDGPGDLMNVTFRDQRITLNRTTAIDLAAITQVLGAIVHKREVTAESDLGQSSLSGPSDNLAHPASTSSRAPFSIVSISPKTTIDKREQQTLFSRFFDYSQYIIRMFLLILFNTLLNLFQLYGRVLITVQIVSFLSDILKRINDQNQLIAAMSNLDSLNPSSSDELTLKTNQYRRLSQSHSPPLMSATELLPTTEVLIQIRDVLIALKQAVGLDYLVIQTYDISQLIVLVGSILAISLSDKAGWAMVFTYEYLKVVTSIIMTRISYQWLHNEARKIRLTYEQILLDTDIETRSPMTLAADEDLDGRFNCGTRPSRASLSREASFQRQELDEQRHISKIEAITNCRLAREIESLWPTDWFLPDMKSCLSLNLLVVTFVATLQQLVGVGERAGGHNRAK